MNDGKLITLRDVTIHNPATISVEQTFLNSFNLPSNAEINFGNGNTRLISSATIQSGNAIWQNVTLGTGDIVITIDDFVFDPQQGGFVRNTLASLPKITVKPQQVAYVKPDVVWTISTTQTWQRPSELNFVYPSNASAEPDALFKSSSTRDVALLAQLNGNSVGKANAYIKFGNGNSTGQLVKPFIIVDGIDFGSYTTQYTDASVTNTTEPNNRVIRYGDVGWDLLQTGTDESRLDPDDPSDHDFLQNYPQLFNTLLTEGYDIVFLDFERGADYIQKNGLLLIELLRKVNQEKLYHDCQHRNIVLGASMGGQVARYALRKMEMLGEDHDTRTYVSFDSPHKGANIPLSLQAAALWVDKAGLKTGALSLWQRLNLPAARQLIVKQLGIEMQSGYATAFKWDVPSFDPINLENMNYVGIRNQYLDEMSTLAIHATHAI